MKRIIFFLLIGSMVFADGIGMVKQLKGDVKVKRENQTLPLKVGSRLYRGDMIITKESGEVGIIFDDGTRISLGKKAIFVIREFEVDPIKKNYNVDLDLQKGKAIFSSGRIGKLSPQSVKFHIPEGIIGIRGTQFAVEVE